MSERATPSSELAYRQHVVWDDETGETYYIDGHVRPERRAVAAMNHYVRQACGPVDRNDQLGDVRLEWVTVIYRYVRPDPQFEGDDETAAWCGEDDPLAQAITVIRL